MPPPREDVRRDLVEARIALGPLDPHYFDDTSLLDQLGCRWYMPSPLGEVLPSMPTINLKEQDVSTGPATIYGITPGNVLIRFDSATPNNVTAIGAVTGLAPNQTIRGIDFRPRTGDLYALGSDRVVYRVNPQTAIAVAEGASDPNVVLASSNIGFDFNPTVDNIRVTNDAEDNLRLNPDEGNQLAKDTSLTPAGVDVVGSAYINSSFTAILKA